MRFPFNTKRRHLAKGLGRIVFSKKTFFFSLESRINGNPFQLVEWVECNPKKTCSYSCENILKIEQRLEFTLFERKDLRLFRLAKSGDVSLTPCCEFSP